MSWYQCHANADEAKLTRHLILGHGGQGRGDLSFGNRLE